VAYHFKYKLTADDFAEFNVYTVWHAPWQKKNKIKFLLNSGFYVTISMFAGIIITDKFLPTNKGNYFTSIALALALLVIVIILIYLQEPYRIKNKAKKLVLADENNHILNQAELEITENGICNKDKDSLIYQKWESVIRFAITKDFFYLYTNSIQALIIPKRLFNSQKEIGEFDKFISERVSLASSFRSIGI